MHTYKYEIYRKLLLKAYTKLALWINVEIDNRDESYETVRTKEPNVP